MSCDVFPKSLEKNALYFKLKWKYFKVLYTDFEK